MWSNRLLSVLGSGFRNILHPKSLHTSDSQLLLHDCRCFFLQLTSVAYDDDEVVHLVMELCGGGELFDWIVTCGRYRERAAVVVARTVAEVVRACHAPGVMHRDLKPENFLYASKSEVAQLKAIDFGLSVFFRPVYQPRCGITAPPACRPSNRPQPPQLHSSRSNVTWRWPCGARPVVVASCLLGRSAEPGSTKDVGEQRPYKQKSTSVHTIKLLNCHDPGPGDAHERSAKLKVVALGGVCHSWCELRIALARRLREGRWVKLSGGSRTNSCDCVLR